MRASSRTVCAALVAALLLELGAPRVARAFPAFARKYGLRCTACHEAWPTLSDFGRAFRDNGYQIQRGKDEPIKVHPAYFPASIRLTPQYLYNSASHQVTDQGTMTASSGSVGTIGIDLLTGGTLAKDVSFLVVPTGFTTASGVFLESAWVRFDNIGDSSWLNLKLGRHEVDLPRSAHRPWNLTSTGYQFYGFHPQGSASTFNMGQNQRGIEWVGHDRGSYNRLALSVFSVEGSPGSRNALDTPGVYFHGTTRWTFEDSIVSALRIGAFGAWTTWPSTSLTLGGTPIAGAGGDLRESSRYGATADLWFGPLETPLHAILVYGHGKDDRELIVGGTRDGSFNGGFLELGWTPTLQTTVFGRWDLVGMQTQGNVAFSQDFGDQNALTLGVRYTLGYSDRDEYAVHAEYSSLLTKGTAPDGDDLRNNSVFLGVDFAY